MSDAYALGTHGSSIQVEFPEHLTKMRRTGWGTLIEQNGGSDNWFHFAIPTPTIMNDSNRFIFTKAYFSADLNENVRIEKIHLRSGDELRIEKIVRHSDRKLIDETIVPGTRSSVLPISLSIYARFLTGTPKGQIIFRHAGAELEFQ